MELPFEADDQVVKDLRTLALGPLRGVKCFNGYIANGFRFHTRDTEKKRVNQNSGVMVNGTNGSKEVDYYGILTKIIELQYLDGKRVVLFRCDWWDVHKIGRSIKIDNHGFVSVNTRFQLRTKEPFVLMSQAQQVFYVSDGFDPNWLVVIKTHPRHHYNVLEKEIVEEEDALQQNEPRSSQGATPSPSDVADIENIDYALLKARSDIGDMIVDANDANLPNDFDGNEDDDDFDDETESEGDSDSDQESDDDYDIA